MTKNLLLFSFLFLANFLFGQKIVSAELQESLTQEELSDRLALFPAQFGVDAYKVLYETADTDGTIDTASGFVVLPIKSTADQQFPFLAYQHGTSASRDAVPSNPENGERLLVYFFAGQGYYTTAADYLGLGDSRRVIHPYIHADSEASAGIDLVKATKTFVEELDLPISPQLFLTGYSQGGHASMAMHRALQTSPIPDLLVAAGSHMSGIYNTSGELLDASISEAVYNFPSYVVWIIVGYQSVYGNLYDNLSEIFRPDYLEDVRGFVNGTITRATLNDLLVETLTENHGASIPRFMLTESFINAFENEPDGPFQTALRDNDLFDWVPETPLRMMYCTADEQVDFTNATFTDSLMNANGAADVASVDVNTEADHGGCVIPASLATLIFFEGFAERPLILSTQRVDISLQFSLQPNPAKDYLTLSFDNTFSPNQDYQLRLVGMNGQILQSAVTNNLQNFYFPLNDISSGVYLMQIQTDNGFWTEKVVVRRG
ncbi:MAG: T9SS type A sorting domain-containing protein [Bacteroidota bacterium]